MLNRPHLLAAIAAMLALQPFAVTQLSATEPANSISADGSSTAASDKNSSESKDGKAKPQKICHRETPTGSIRPVRVCRTQEQIDAEAKQAQDSIDELSRTKQQPASQSLRGG